VKFGRIAVAGAAGAILGHSQSAGGRHLKKGHVLTAADVEAIAAAGVSEILAARLEDGDVPEDQAAAALAQALVGPGARVATAFTGRANLYAEAPGLAQFDVAAIDAINLIDEAVTVATVPAFEEVEPGQMLATVKIIPFSVPRVVLDRCLAELAGRRIGVAAYRPARAGLISTSLPDTKPSVLTKTEGVMADRLATLGAELADTRRVRHDEALLADMLQAQLGLGLDPLLVVGASAIVDRGDVIPAALEGAGGRVEHLGMPVDPGNLLMVGDLSGVPVIGAPGCARSPKENGFDWVLMRLLAGLTVTRTDITGMGVGGLLMEIVSRPQPREGDQAMEHAPRIAAIVLAAGRSTRMGGPNKLLAEAEGAPLVVHAVKAALASQAVEVVVVLGHMADDVRAAVEKAVPPRSRVRFVTNPDFAQGLSTSVRTGIGALPTTVDAAVVQLGDMPGVGAPLLNRLMAAFSPVEGRAICVPTVGGKRGNPVLWARRFFPEMAKLSGDSGAKHLIGEYADLVCEVEMTGEAAITDIDTPEALAAWRARSTA